MLLIQPTWSNRELTPVEMDLTNEIYRIFLRVTTGRAAIRRQVERVSSHRGRQNISMLTGNLIDDDFKRQIERARQDGLLPQNLEVTPNALKQPGKRGPDLWMERVAWDITTAEDGARHIKRDVLNDPLRWDAYFVLGY